MSANDPAQSVVLEPGLKEAASDQRSGPVIPGQSEPSQPSVKMIAIIIASVVTVILLVLVTPALFLGYQMAKTMPDPTAFSSTVWKASPATCDHDSMRQRMVDDLLASKKLIGLQQSEVEALIGPSDGPYYGYDLCYMVGGQRGMGPDNEFLLIKLDEAGRVSEAILYTH